jgi:hypothetical protein
MEQKPLTADFRPRETQLPFAGPAAWRLGNDA